ncbi:MAG: hypothetical protein NT038_01745 [Euryarchaeota archaeon]|nr:hypothetical protein [Euryarchaeota archaeon]
MSLSENSELVRYLLQAFVSVVGRRTSENFAMVTLDTIVKQLEPKYNFLKFIEINPSRYSDGKDAISINPEINSIRPSDLGEALNEILDRGTESLDKKTDHYVKREIKDALGSMYELINKKLELNLHVTQSEYLVDADVRRIIPGIVQIKNSEVVEPVLGVLINLLNGEFSEADVMKTMITFIKNLEGKYDFLKYIEISDSPDSDGFFVVRARPEIDDVLTITFREAMQKLIEEIGKSTHLKTQLSFIKDFKMALAPADLEKIKEMNINLDQIGEILHRRENELLFKKALDAIVGVVSRKTSKSFAVALLDTIIEKLRDGHKVLRYVVINKSRYADGIDSICILPEVNSVTSYELGKGLKEILKKTRENLGYKHTSFIEDFQKQLGDEYLAEIEKMGVNLYMIELKFI